MLFKLAIKSIVSRKSSIVIIIFMAFSAMLLSVANAVFDSTEQGVESNFISSFTGDFIIRPKSNVPLSLFGDETPVTGELTEIEKVVPYPEIVSVLQQNPLIKDFIPQVTGMAILEFNKNQEPICLFGVSADKYLSIMDSIHLLQGEAYNYDDKSVMMSQKIAKKIGVSVGDTIQFIVVDGPTFRIRGATVSGIYTYGVDNPIFEKFILASPVLVKSIMDISDSVDTQTEIAEEKSDLLEDDLNFDDLFAFADDVDAVIEEENSIEEETFLEIEIKDNSTESTAWNFIVCRVKDNNDTKKVIRSLNRLFKTNDWPVEAVNWRHAAGSIALYLYWMRIIFNIGIIIVLVAGFIVVNNTLVINVLDRTREIGTIRAIGGGKLFVSLQCMIETMIMAIIAAILGCFLGTIISDFITSLQIALKNDFLIQLFGSNALVTKMSVLTVVKIFLLMICLGIVGWIYPVATAIKVNPVKAIQGEK